MGTVRFNAKPHYSLIRWLIFIILFFSLQSLRVTTTYEDHNSKISNGSCRNKQPCDIDPDRQSIGHCHQLNQKNYHGVNHRRRIGSITIIDDLHLQ